jgi:hypothetical protein
MEPRALSAGVMRRRRSQKGQELLEFGLVMGFLLVPLFLGMIVYGTNLIQSNQVNALCREIGSMYIGGTDLSLAASQKTVSTLAAGLNLQVGTTGGAANTSNSTGSGIVTITQMTYVGNLNQITCSNNTPCNTTSFVFMQRIKFGNGSLATAPASLAGDPSGATMNAQGVVANPYADTTARLPSTQNADMKTLWNAGNTGGLQDGQTVYLVETYVESSGFSFGQGAKGIYAKFFF